MIAQGRGPHIDPNGKRGRDLARELGAQVRKQSLTRPGDPAADDHALRIDEHQGGAQPAGQVDQVAAAKGGILQQLRRRTPLPGLDGSTRSFNKFALM